MKSFTSNPLVDKYASKELTNIFADKNRYVTWRELWIALAEEQKLLGLNISDSQISSMKKAKDNIDFEEVDKIERELMHDVMAHLHHFANLAPEAKAIMHLGATSEFIKDNTDLILIKEALDLIENKLIKLIRTLQKFTIENKDIATVGFTHFQVAQPTTVGRRACLWLQSLFLDLKELHFVKDNLQFRGIKGTTGTLASFKKLFDNNYDVVKKLNQNITKRFGFKNSYTITGQTYDRKFDSILINMLGSIGVSAHKITNDIRLLQNLKELEEGFGQKQIGSSAMPYKKNPIKCERVSSLAKYLMCLPQSANLVAATQWLERTLDDSANRRITIPQSFYTADSIIILLDNIIENLNVNKKVIDKNLNSELPFLATENIMMEAVKKGGNRQDLHEKIRMYSMETKTMMVEEGKDNDLIQKILGDQDFMMDNSSLKNIMNINNFIGFSIEQVLDFNKQVNDYLK